MKGLIALACLVSLQATAYEDFTQVCDHLRQGTATESELDEAQAKLDQISEYMGEQLDIQIEEYCEL